MTLNNIISKKKNILKNKNYLNNNDTSEISM